MYKYRPVSRSPNINVGMVIILVTAKMVRSMRGQLTDNEVEGHAEDPNLSLSCAMRSLRTTWVTPVIKPRPMKRKFPLQFPYASE